MLNYCDYWITSNVQYYKWLNKYSYTNKNYICPVHSNINHKVSKVKKNKKLAVIFGTEGSRVLIYKKYFNELKSWVLENNIDLFDIGPKLKNLNLNLLCKDKFEIKIMGKLKSKKLSNILSRATYGIFITQDDLIDKSGVMAAYSFYKVCPINLFKFSNKNIKNKRFLKYLPNLKIKNSTIKRIVQLNQKLSKKNSLKQLIYTYRINFI